MAGTEDGTLAGGRGRATGRDSELRIGLVRAEEHAAAGERIATAELAAKEAVIVELRAMLAEARRPWLERLLAAIRR